jgi:two-component system cell cycle response regulator
MRILVADDDKIATAVLTRTLKLWGYEPVVAEDGIAALKILSGENAPELMILDWMMPGMTGAELCRYIRKSSLNSRYVYTLVLTGKTERKDLVEALESGADDFISKPFHPDELRVRLRTAVRILELQSALLTRARNDSLTGLLNHGAILEELAKEFNRCRRENKPVSILLADLDHFKQINDRHGHQTGDSVLRAAAERIRSAVRCYDHIGRYGGEEFLIVLPGCDIEDALKLSDRVRNCVQAESDKIPFTISIGIATTHHLNDVSELQLVCAADEALYKAKENGRNRAEVSSAFAGVIS